METETEQFIRRLRTALKKSKLTPYAFGNRLDVIPLTLSRWIRGTSKPSKMNVKMVGSSKELKKLEGMFL